MASLIDLLPPINEDDFNRWQADTVGRLMGRRIKSLDQPAPPPQPDYSSYGQRPAELPPEPAPQPVSQPDYMSYGQRPPEPPPPEPPPVQSYQEAAPYQDTQTVPAPPTPATISPRQPGIGERVGDAGASFLDYANQKIASLGQSVSDTGSSFLDYANQKIASLGQPTSQPTAEPPVAPTPDMTLAQPFQDAAARPFAEAPVPQAIGQMINAEGARLEQRATDFPLVSDAFNRARQERLTGAPITPKTPEEQAALDRTTTEIQNIVMMSGSPLKNVGGKAAKPFKPPSSHFSAELDTEPLPGGGGTIPPVEPPKPPPGTPPPPSPPGGERAGNILLPKYVDLAVQDEIRAVWAADPAKAEAARRGVIPDAEVRQMAQDMGVQNVDRFVKQWKPGQAANSETIYALRDTLAAKTKNVIDAKAVLGKTDTTENALKFQLALKEQQAIQEVVHGVTAEAGRGLAQFRQTIDGAIASGDQNQMQKLLEQMGGRKWNDELTKKFSLIDDTDSLAVYKFLRDVNKPGARDKMLAITIENMFTGRTLLVNGFGNSVESVNRPLLTLLGGERQAAQADVQAMGAAVRVAWQRGAIAFKEGVRMSDVEGTVGVGKYDVRHRDAFPGKAGMLLTPKLRVAGATDEFFRTINSAGGYAAEAVREAKRQGKTIAEVLANPTPAMRAEASRAGSAAVFEDKPSSLGRSVMDIRSNFFSDEPGKVAIGTFGYAVLPFVKIADSIYGRGAKLLASPVYDPLAIAVKVARGKTAGVRGNVSRVALAVPLIYTWGAMAVAGNLTGNGPKDPAKRQMLMDATDAQGNPLWAMHSVRIDGRWYDYTNLGPAAIPMAAIGNAVESYQTEGLKPDPNQAVAVANETAKSLMDASFIQAIGNFFKAFDQGGIVPFGEQLTADVATRFVPQGGVISQIGRGFDADTKTPQGVGERILAKYPIVKESVPTKLSPLGREVSQPQDLLTMVSPVRTTAPQQQNAVANEVARLQSQGQKLSVGYVGQTVKKIDLSREEQRQYQEITGKEIETILTGIMANPKYQALTDAGKTKVLQLGVDDAKSAGAWMWIGTMNKEELVKRLKAKAAKAAA